MQLFRATYINYLNIWNSRYYFSITIIYEIRHDRSQDRIRITSHFSQLLLSKSESHKCKCSRKRSYLISSALQCQVSGMHYKIISIACNRITIMIWVLFLIEVVSATSNCSIIMMAIDCHCIKICIMNFHILRLFSCQHVVIKRFSLDMHIFVII